MINFIYCLLLNSVLRPMTRIISAKMYCKGVISVPPPKKNITTPFSLNTHYFHHSTPSTCLLIFHSPLAHYHYFHHSTPVIYPTTSPHPCKIVIQFSDIYHQIPLWMLFHLISSHLSIFLITPPSITINFTLCNWPNYSKDPWKLAIPSFSLHHWFCS